MNRALATGAILATALAPVFVAAPAGGQNPLTLEAAIQRAAARHPTVESARHATAEARARTGEAGAARFPSLSLDTKWTQFEEQMLVTPIHAFRPAELPPFDRTLIQSGLRLNYTLFDGGARGARIRGAESQEAASEAELDATTQGLIVQTSATYLDVLSARATLDAHERRLAALAAEEARVAALAEAGRAAEVDRLRVEAVRASAEAEQVEHRTAIDLAERDLARLLDAAVEETRAERLVPVRLADPLAVERSALVERALATSPRVRAARERQAVAAAGLDLAKGARWPEIGLGANLDDWRDDDGDHSTEWNAGVRLKQPLFTGGQLSERVAGARADTDQAAEELRLAELDAGAAVDRALGQVVEAEAQVQSLERAVERFVEVARIEQLLLETGPGTQTDYLEAEADLLQARAHLVAAQHGAILARIELARVTGELDTAWITTYLETIR